MVVMFHQFVTIRCQLWLNCIDQAVLWVDPVKFELIRLFFWIDLVKFAPIR